MRLLVLSDRYPPHYEGAYELTSARIVEHLRSKGYSVDVLTTTFGVPHEIVEGHVHRRLRFAELDELKASGWARRRIQLRLLRDYRRNYRITRSLARKLDPSLVFVCHMASTSILPILAVQDLGLPTVYRVGSHWLMHLRNEQTSASGAFRSWYRSALLGFRRFDELRFEAAVFNSAALLADYEAAGFDFRDASVVPNGLDDEWIANAPPQRSTGEPLRVLFVGRLGEPKGPQVAIAAAGIAVREHGVDDLRLQLFGNGTARQHAELRQQIGEAGLEGIVTIAGFVPRDDLRECYRTHHVLVFPTLRWEGHPMAVTEAMASGLIVVASDIGGTRDLIDHGRNGILVPPDDPKALAATLADVASFRAKETEAMGLAAIETVRRKFRVARMLTSYETYLPSLPSRAGVTVS